MSYSDVIKRESTNIQCNERISNKFSFNVTKKGTNKYNFEFQDGDKKLGFMNTNNVITEIDGKKVFIPNQVNNHREIQIFFSTTLYSNIEINKFIDNFKDVIKKNDYTFLSNSETNNTEFNFNRIKIDDINYNFKDINNVIAFYKKYKLDLTLSDIKSQLELGEKDTSFDFIFDSTGKIKAKFMVNQIMMLFQNKRTLQKINKEYSKKLNIIDLIKMSLHPAFIIFKNINFRQNISEMYKIHVEGLGKKILNNKVYTKREDNINKIYKTLCLNVEKRNEKIHKKFRNLTREGINTIMNSLLLLPSIKEQLSDFIREVNIHIEDFSTLKFRDFKLSTTVIDLKEDNINHSYVDKKFYNLPNLDFKTSIENYNKFKKTVKIYNFYKKFIEKNKIDNNLGIKTELFENANKYIDTNLESDIKYIESIYQQIKLRENKYLQTIKLYEIKTKKINKSLKKIYEIDLKNIKKQEEFYSKNPFDSDKFSVNIDLHELNTDESINIIHNLANEINIDDKTSILRISSMLKEIVEKMRGESTVESDIIADFGKKLKLMIRLKFKNINYGIMKKPNHEFINGVFLKNIVYLNENGDISDIKDDNIITVSYGYSDYHVLSTISDYDLKFSDSGKNLISYSKHNSKKLYGIDIYTEKIQLFMEEVFINLTNEYINEGTFSIVQTIGSRNAKYYKGVKKDIINKVLNTINNIEIIKKEKIINLDVDVLDEMNTYFKKFKLERGRTDATIPSSRSFGTPISSVSTKKSYKEEEKEKNFINRLDILLNQDNILSRFLKKQRGEEEPLNILYFILTILANMQYTHTVKSKDGRKKSIAERFKSTVEDNLFKPISEKKNISNIKLYPLKINFAENKLEKSKLKKIIIEEDSKLKINPIFLMDINIDDYYMKKLINVFKKNGFILHTGRGNTGEANYKPFIHYSNFDEFFDKIIYNSDYFYNIYTLPEEIKDSEPYYNLQEHIENVDSHSIAEELITLGIDINENNFRILIEKVLNGSLVTDDFDKYKSGYNGSFIDIIDNIIDKTSSYDDIKGGEIIKERTITIRNQEIINNINQYYYDNIKDLKQLLEFSNLLNKKDSFTLEEINDFHIISEKILQSETNFNLNLIPSKYEIIQTDLINNNINFILNKLINDPKIILTDEYINLKVFSYKPDIAIFIINNFLQNLFIDENISLGSKEEIMISNVKEELKKYGYIMNDKINKYLIIKHTKQLLDKYNKISRNKISYYYIEGTINFIELLATKLRIKTMSINDTINFVIYNTNIPYEYFDINIYDSDYFINFLGDKYENVIDNICSIINKVIRDNKIKYEIYNKVLNEFLIKEDKSDEIIKRTFESDKPKEKLMIILKEILIYENITSDALSVENLNKILRKEIDMMYNIRRTLEMGFDTAKENLTKLKYEILSKVDNINTINESISEIKDSFNKISIDTNSSIEFVKTKMERYVNLNIEEIQAKIKNINDYNIDELLKIIESSNKDIDIIYKNLQLNIRNINEYKYANYMNDILKKNTINELVKNINDSSKYIFSKIKVIYNNGKVIETNHSKNLTMINSIKEDIMKYNNNYNMFNEYIEGLPRKDIMTYPISKNIKLTYGGKKDDTYLLRNGIFLNKTISYVKGRHSYKDIGIYKPFKQLSFRHYNIIINLGIELDDYNTKYFVNINDFDSSHSIIIFDYVDFNIKIKTEEQKGKILKPLYYIKSINNESSYFKFDDSTIKYYDDINISKIKLTYRYFNQHFIYYLLQKYPSHIIIILNKNKKILYLKSSPYIKKGPDDKLPTTVEPNVNKMLQQTTNFLKGKSLEYVKSDIILVDLSKIHQGSRRNHTISSTSSDKRITSKKHSKKKTSIKYKFRFIDL